MRIRALFVLVSIGLLLSCGSSSRGASEPGPSAAGMTYHHDLTHLDGSARCGRCIRYTFRWPTNTRAQLALSTRGFAGKLVVYDGAERRHEGREADPDGVIRVNIETGTGEVHVMVAPIEDHAQPLGPVALVVRPAPEELELPKPPPSLASLQAAENAKHEKLVNESMRAYADATARLSRVTKVVGDLADPRPLSIQITSGSCYRAILTTDKPLVPPAGWTRAFFGREAIVRGTWPGMSQGSGMSVRRDRLTGVSNELCPTGAGTLAVTWPTKKVDPVVGRYSLEVWSRKLTSNELQAVKSKEQSHKNDIHAGSCLRCQRDVIRCLDGNNVHGSCVRSFRQCLSDSSLSQSQCPL